MARLLGKLALLLSLLIMPFGMTGRAAAAHHHAPEAMNMPAGHCDGGAQPRDHAPTGIAQCTMACAATLPAIDPPVIAPPNAVTSTPHPRASATLRGLRPTTELPPPRQA